ncbi:MAG: hypothetical protein N3G75_09230 [Methanothrix sp.]|nr:hypothetical protein [Methanothrix sp.]MCX8207989.1 hypothetical protein [Methanothrix sp.]
MRSPGIVDFRKYKYFAVLMACICFAGAVIAGANIIQTAVSGSGKFFVQHNFQESGDIAGTKSGDIAYSYERHWDRQTATGRSMFIVTGATGSYEDQYVVRGSAAGTKVEYRVEKLFGDFSGSQEIKVIIEDSGEENFDNLILLKGNATYYGKIRTVDKMGRPLDAETLFGIGEFVVRSYINVSSEIQKPEDWLAFCDEVSEELTAA